MQVINDANGWISVLPLEVLNRTEYANATTAADTVLIADFEEHRAVTLRFGGVVAGNFGMVICTVATAVMWRKAVHCHKVATAAACGGGESKSEGIFSSEEKE